MTTPGQPERSTQNRLVRFFQDTLKYDYLGDWKDRDGNSNVEVAILQKNLTKRGYSAEYIRRAVAELTRTAGNQTDSLYEVNKRVYRLLRYGVKFRPEAGQQTATVWLIDWQNPENNDFAIAEEVTIGGQHTKRPDIVVYVNGIALGVLELKRSKVSVSEGIRQNLDNQQPRFIERFFTTQQFVMAGNDTQGLRYGTIETPEKYYLEWKEDSAAIVTGNMLDDALVHICQKERLLELIHDFIIFDSGTKKICRPNQYFGVKAAQARIQNREGGIIWHTQGSGKSLTMVWLTRWIRERYSDARVLVITDRTELDEQIERIYNGVDEQIYRTSSGADLIHQLSTPEKSLLCSLIHKFPGQDEGDVNDFLRELQSQLPTDFAAVGNFFVFVDECHRTQSGMLHAGMRALLPNALFIGFTGTPLLKVDKQNRTSIETFGTYIHTYKYNEAVEDGVVLDLRYEAREIDQHLSSDDKVDAWFDTKTAGLTDYASAQLKQRWGTMRSVLSSRRRLNRIVDDILIDMEIKPRLSDGRGNALLVAGSIYEACKFYELFTQRGFTRCAIITSYEPNVSHIKGETTGDGDTEDIEKYEIYQQMLNGKSVDAFERDVKKTFIEEPARMKLLIVVDKLLTGFDAPSATYLYIDKNMRDHGLFQAICRVNRLDGEDKEYGYIIDYKDLFKSLKQSIQDYTSEAFDGFDAEDVDGLLENRVEKGRERLEQAREQIKALCEPVAPPRDTRAYIQYFCGDPGNPDDLKATERRRHDLYTYTISLIRAYAALANDLRDAGYTEAEIRTIQDEVAHFEAVREEIKLASGDKIDLKQYEPAMRKMLDLYIQADESRTLSAFDDLTLIELIVTRGPDVVDALPDSIASDPGAVAETIENNVRRVIIDERPANEAYYDRMSALLNALIEERRQQAIDYEAYLQRIADLARQVYDPLQATGYPTTITTRGKQALYDRLEDEELALRVHNAVEATKKHGWRDSIPKEREIKRAIFDQVSDRALTEALFAIIKQQREY